MTSLNSTRVTYQQARKAFEQCGLSHCDDKVKELMEEYFGSSKEGEDVEGKIVKGAVIVKRIQKDWMPSTSGDPRTRQEAVPVDDKGGGLQKSPRCVPGGNRCKITRFEEMPHLYNGTRGVLLKEVEATAVRDARQ
ncbi:uncharacterized protein [Aquarana catesbeiana]|uniref:uncharacterized protein isoform X2 n=1 Tax=Aquarana catesbeiana TaxID=8400 RepID=UPI003CC98656